MNHPKPVLYFGPGTCSLAAMIALEETGAPYEARVVTYMEGEHRTPEYLAMNPNGKTPLLVVEGQSIFEASAILYYLDKRYPNAKLMPKRDNLVAEAQDIADLIWCSSELHPNVFRIRIPQYFCDMEGGRERQRDMAVTTMHQKFQMIEDRLADRPWFLGHDWSSVDAYLMWVWFRLQGTIFDSSAYPKFEDHYARMLERPAVQRAGKIEMDAAMTLKAKGAVVNFETFKPGTKPEHFKAQMDAEIAAKSSN